MILVFISFFFPYSHKITGPYVQCGYLLGRVVEDIIVGIVDKSFLSLGHTLLLGTKSDRGASPTHTLDDKSRHTRAYCSCLVFKKQEKHYRNLSFCWIPRTTNHTAQWICKTRFGALLKLGFKPSKGSFFYFVFRLS